jgi:hypothetical protein
MELNLYRFLNDVFHASRFLGQGTEFVNLEVVIQVNATLRMPKSDVPVVFFETTTIYGETNQNTKNSIGGSWN